LLDQLTSLNNQAKQGVMKFPQQANKKANSFLLDEIDQDQDKDQDLSSNPSLKTRPTANFDIEK